MRQYIFSILALLTFCGHCCASYRLGLRDIFDNEDDNYYVQPKLRPEQKFLEEQLEKKEIQDHLDYINGLPNTQKEQDLRLAQEKRWREQEKQWKEAERDFVRDSVNK